MKCYSNTTYRKQEETYRQFYDLIKEVLTRKKNVKRLLNDTIRFTYQSRFKANNY